MFGWFVVEDGAPSYCSYENIFFLCFNQVGITWTNWVWVFSFSDEERWIFKWKIKNTRALQPHLSLGHKFAPKTGPIFQDQSFEIKLVTVEYSSRMTAWFQFRNSMKIVYPLSSRSNFHVPRTSPKPKKVRKEGSKSEAIASESLVFAELEPLLPLMKYKVLTYRNLY